MQIILDSFKNIEEKGYKPGSRHKGCQSEDDRELQSYRDAEQYCVRVVVVQPVKVQSSAQSSPATEIRLKLS